MTPVAPTGPIVGCRVWSYRLHLGVHLTGIGPYGGKPAAVWRPGVNEAICCTPMMHEEMEGSSNRVPGTRCGCGFHSYYDWEQRRLRSYHGYIGYINGIVRGWGAMERHPDGWRAQFAEVLALISGVNEKEDPRVIQVAERYKVPVIPVTAVEAVLSEFGDIFPKEWRPSPKRSHDKERGGPDGV